MFAEISNRKFWNSRKAKALFSAYKYFYISKKRDCAKIGTVSFFICYISV